MTFDTHGRLMKTENPEAATNLGITVFSKEDGSKPVAEIKKDSAQND
jgi:hypothetical protein